MRKQLGVWKQGVKGEMDSRNVSERSEGAAGGVEAKQGQKCDRATRGSGRGCGGCRRAWVGKKAARKKVESIFAAAASKKIISETRERSERGEEIFMGLRTCKSGKW